MLIVIHIFCPGRLNSAQISVRQRACPAKLGRYPSPHCVAARFEQWLQCFHHWNHAKPPSETCTCTVTSMSARQSHESWPPCKEIGVPNLDGFHPFVHGYIPLSQPRLSERLVSRPLLQGSPAKDQLRLEDFRLYASSNWRVHRPAGVVCFFLTTGD